MTADVEEQAGADHSSLPRTLLSPKMCLVTNVTDDPVGSMAYRPTDGACTAVLVVGMTAVPFMWDQGVGSPGAVAPAKSPSAEHVLRNGRSRPSRRPEPPLAPNELAPASLNMFTRASK